MNCLQNVVKQLKKLGRWPGTSGDSERARDLDPKNKTGAGGYFPRLLSRLPMTGVRYGFLFANVPALDSRSTKPAFEFGRDLPPG